MKISMTAVLAACCSALLSVPVAEAACTQADATGTWYVMGFSVDTVDSGVEWDRCKIRVASNGAVIPSGSSCQFRYSGGRYSATLGNGTVRMASSCGVSGNISACVAGIGCAALKIEYGQLDRGKSVMSFVGYAVQDTATIYSFTGIRQ